MTLAEGVDRSVATYGSVEGMDAWSQEELDELARAVIHGVPGSGSEGQVLRVVHGRLVWSNVDDLPVGHDGQVVRFTSGGKATAGDLASILPKLPTRADVPASGQAQLPTPLLASLAVVAQLVGVVNGLLTNQEALRKRINELQADLKTKGYMADK